MKRLTINIKKRYDDYMLYNGDTAYTSGKLPRSAYVSLYKEDIYMPRNDSYVNASKRECYNKLGKLEDLLENADSIKIIKRNGVASLHIDMILDDETYPIAEQFFGKEKVVDYDK